MTETAILQKVQKLLRLSTSSNANEAALAAAKAQELIDRHHLTQAMLALDEAEPVKGLDDEPIVDFDDAPLDTPKKLDRWRGALGIELARANACKVWARGSHLMIVGRPSDAETMRYLYAWLSREVERLATEHGQGKGRTWRNNFRLGVVETIGRKLKEQHDAFERTVRAEAQSSQALMRVNQGLACLTERRMDVYRWVKENMKLVSRGASATTYDGSARRAGQRAGESIALRGGRARLTSAAKKLPA